MVWEEPRMLQHESGHHIVNWRIRNFAKVPRDTGLPIESKTVTIANESFCLELFAGGRTGTHNDFVSIFLTKKRHYDWEPTIHMDFRISICNQTMQAEALTKTAPLNSAFPGPLGVDSKRNARVGWDDFMKLSDLLDPCKGFFVLDEIIVKAEISLAIGFLREMKSQELTGCTLKTSIKKLLGSPILSDVKLIAEGQEFDVHRVILASRSEVFENMFTTGMTEATGNAVHVEDITAETMKLMLQFIYEDTFAVADAEPQLIGDLLKAAKKYDIPRLSSLCEKRALTAITVNSVIDWLMLATMLGIQEIKNECMRVVTANLAEVQITEGWGRLVDNPQLMKELMPSIVQMMCPPAKRSRTE